jgi:hypothetical protein
MRNLFHFVTAGVIFLATFQLQASENHNKLLFDTFYLEGDRVTYMITIKEDRTFDLYGSNKEHVSGTWRASEEDITLTAGDVTRYFKYDPVSAGIRIERIIKEKKKDDHLVKGNLLGIMPPAGFNAVIYVSEENWKGRGRPLLGEEPKTPPKRTITPLTKKVTKPSDNPEPPAAKPETTTPAVSFADLSGAYYLASPDGNYDMLAVFLNGQFEFVASDGASQRGTLLRDGCDLTFVGKNHKRSIAVRVVDSGLELLRCTNDTTFPGDLVGEMPPQERQPLVWRKKLDDARANPSHEGKTATKSAATTSPPAAIPEPPKTTETTVSPKVVNGVPPAPPDASKLIEIPKPVDVPKTTETVVPAKPYTETPTATAEIPKTPSTPVVPATPTQPPPPPPTPPPPSPPLPPGAITPPLSGNPPPATATPKAPESTGTLQIDSPLAIEGSFAYKPNPFMTETVAFNRDGSFSYKDSSGNGASGAFKFEAQVLVMTSGDVVRRLKAEFKDGALLLTRTNDDKPVLKNDLAQMSPSTQKCAQYEKK